MKAMLTGLIAAAVLLGYPLSRQVRASSDVTLASAEAVFETTTNDKDHDSIVSIVVKRGNTIIASSSNTDGHWNNNTTHAVTLDVGGGWSRNDLKDKTKTELSFSTNGNDRWEFNYILHLTWSDGTTTEIRSNGQVLTQDDRFRSYTVSL